MSTTTTFHLPPWVMLMRITDTYLAACVQHAPLGVRAVAGQIGRPRRGMGSQP